MSYEPTRLKLWTRPDSYFGKNWPEYYVFMSKHRDSDVLTRSNFYCALNAIGGESETVNVIREGHWGVGWIEWIAIHKDDENALRAAEKIMEKLDDYPVVDEMHWSEMELDEAAYYWENMSVRERAHYCRDAGISIFAARRNYMPDDQNGYLFDLLRDGL